MKYLFLLIAIILTACDHRVKFADPMPPEIDIESTIPDFFLGTYVCESDSSRLHVDKYMAIKETYYIFETSVAEVNETENCSLVAGGLYLLGRKECIPFEFISEDSISAKVYDLDTIFAFRKDEVMKYHLGHLFINYMNKNQEWETWRFTPQLDGSIAFEFLAIPNDEEKIKRAAYDYETRIDSMEKVHYILNPTKKEFEEILTKDYMFQCDILVPINLEKGY